MKVHRELSNVLRVTPSFASLTNPGSGTNAYFHSKFSRFNSFILTEDRGLEYLKVNGFAKIYTVKTFYLGLGKVGSTVFIVLFLSKVISTLIFTLKSVKYIRLIKPEVVHLYSPIYLLVGIYCKLLYGSQIVMSIHGTDGLRINNNKLLGVLLKIPDLTLSLSRKFIKDTNNLDVKFLGNGYDDSLFTYHRNLRTKRFISVGNLRWQKGHIYMIRAFCDFYKTNKHYELIIVGDGELRDELKKEVSKLGLDKVVSLVGKKSQEEIVSLMNESSFFVLTSVSEGFPKVVYEALACGLPVLSTDVGDVRRKVDENSGLIVKSDVKSISEGMTRLVKTPFDRLSISENVKVDGWKYIGEQLDDYYVQIRK